MENKIIVIQTKGSSKEHLTELQEDLFNNGYKWVHDDKKIQTFYSFEPIVIIDKIMYTMSYDDIRYLRQEDKVEATYIEDIITYFRMLKLKKLKNEK